MPNEIISKTRGKIPGIGQVFAEKSYSGKPGIFRLYRVGKGGERLPYYNEGKIRSAFWQSSTGKVFRPGTTTPFIETGETLKDIPQYNIADVADFFESKEWADIRGVPYKGRQRYTEAQMRGDVPTFGEIQETKATSEELKRYQVGATKINPITGQTVKLNPDGKWTPMTGLKEPLRTLTQALEASGVYTSDDTRDREEQTEEDQEFERDKEIGKLDQDIELLGKQKQKSDLEAELGIGEAPEAPSLRETYEDLMSSPEITDLEKGINDYKKRIRDLDLSYKMGKEEISEKLAPMSLITGRQEKLYNQYQNQRTALTNELATLQDAYNTKIGVIENLMDLTQQDFQNSLNAYSQQFSQSMRLYDLISSKKETEQKTAQANLDIVLNSLMSNGKNWDTASISEQNMLKKLSLQSGIDLDIIKASLQTKQEPDITYHYDAFTDADKRTGTQIIKINKSTGEITTQKVYSGVEGDKITKSFLTSTDYRNLAIKEIPKDVADAISIALQEGNNLEDIRRGLAEQYGRDKGYKYLDDFMVYIQSRASRKGNEVTNHWK